MAAPMMIIKKVFQTEKELHVVLHPAARANDVSAFLMLSFSINGNDNTIANAIIEKAKADGTSFSKGMIEAREKKELTINLISDQKISSLEMYDGNLKIVIAVE